MELGRGQKTQSPCWAPSLRCDVSAGCLRIYSFCLFPAPIKAGNYKPGQQQID